MRFTLVAVFLNCALAAVAQGAGTDKLTIHADRPGPKVSPTLYGLFFEEINMAGDGGLYAELVRNRSFEDSDKPEHWTLIADGGSKGNMAIATARPMSGTNVRSLKLTVNSAGGGRAGVANNGYFGIGLKKNARYELSLAARAADGFSGPLTITLESSDGSRVYANTEINGLTDSWKVFEPTLTAADSDPKARLVIAST
jgi:hypothetical protein